MEGIDQGFQHQQEPIDIRHEFLDAKRLPALTHGTAFLSQLQLKYPESSLNLIMVSDDPALRLVLTHRDTYFSTVPIVYLGINTVEPEIVTAPNMTGVFEVHNTVETALGALQQTDSEALLVFNDSTETGNANLGGIRQLRAHPQAPETIVFINDATEQTLASALHPYPQDWPILVLGQLRQGHAKGALFSFADTAQILKETLPNPLYAVSTTFMGHGVIGGNVLDPEYHAQQAVNLARQVLTQGEASQIEPITHAKTRWIFDYREIQRFGIHLSDLPPGSKIMYRQPSFYSQYKGLVWMTLGTFMTGLVIILLLVEVIRRRSIAEQLLRENEKRYRDLAEVGASVFWELNPALEFVDVSDEALALNCNRPSQLLGRSLQRIVSENDALDFDYPKFYQVFQTHQPIQDFIFRSQHNGQASTRIFKLSGKPLFDSGGDFAGYRGIQREITQEYELVDTLVYQATHDWLTGLVNRYEFNEHLQSCIDACEQTDVQAVLCYIDLDQFKIVNDTAGHSVGDQLLVEVANIFQAAIRKHDILSRLGGDEFGLILKNCSLPEAQTICSSFLSVLQAYRFPWKNRQFTVGCSIGLVPILKPVGMAIVDLLSRADLACYKAKSLGRGRIYTDVPGDMCLDSDQSVMSYIANLTQYLEEDRFFLVTQKIQSLSLPTPADNHFEVLVRLKDNHQGVISPGCFIPAMEQYGAITILDRWVIETALTQLANVGSETLVSINISGVSLNSEAFLAHTVRILEQSKLPATCLCFEITETAAISHLKEARQFIQILQDLGAKFALDDFGSGFSSFAYLKALPVDFLKIDGSLVKNMLQEPSDLAIVRSVNDIAHMLGMRTIAEFVEDSETLAYLVEMGVDYAQGYGIDKPRPLRYATVSE